MKKFLLPALLLFSFGKIYAQCFQEGNIIVSAGFGVGSLYGNSYYGSYGKRYAIPAVNISAEQGLKKLGPGILAVGGESTFKSSGFHYDASHYNNKNFRRCYYYP